MTGLPEELDARTLAEYRRVLEEAAAQLGVQTSQRVAGATAAVFAALDRRDHERRELLGIARALAGLTPGATTGASLEILALIERARKLVL